MDTTASAQLDDIDRSSLLHPFTDFAAYKRDGGMALVRGEHIYLIDSNGNEMLDGMSGLWCVNLGYSQRRIAKAVTEQLDRLPYYNSFFNCTTDTTVRMTAALRKVLPPGFDHLFFTNSGSEANDTNIRLAHRYFDLVGQPKKKLIIGRRNGYHGSTIAAASLGGMSNMHRQFTGLPYVHHVQQPYAFEEAGEQEAEAFGLRAAASLAAKIDELGAANVAAFIAEPIQGAGGVIVPPASYWPEVARICRERDVLLISDEVICGFGRTGNWWGCQTYGYEPDLISFAKAVTNGYQPLGGVAVGERVADVVTGSGGEFAHGFTWSGHPVACAAGIATLAVYEESAIVERVHSDTARYWANRWQSLADHPIVGEARARGMLGALELVRRKPGKERLDSGNRAAISCRNTAIANGLMVRQVEDAIISAPPLIMTHAEIDLLIERLATALDRTAHTYGVSTG